MLKELIKDLTLKQYCNGIAFTKSKKYDDDPVQLYAKIFDLSKTEQADIYAMPLKYINECEQTFIDIILNSTSLNVNDKVKKVIIEGKTYKVPTVLEDIKYKQFIELDLLIKDFWLKNKDKQQFEINQIFIENNYTILCDALAIILECDIKVAEKCNAKEGTKIANFFLILTLYLKIMKPK